MAAGNESNCPPAARVRTHSALSATAVTMQIFHELPITRSGNAAFRIPVRILLSSKVSEFLIEGKQ